MTENLDIGDFMITFLISSSKTALKKSDLGKYGGAGSMEKSVPENECLILLFCLKKIHKAVGKTFLRVKGMKNCFRDRMQCRVYDLALCFES